MRPISQNTKSVQERWFKDKTVPKLSRKFSGNCRAR